MLSIYLYSSSSKILTCERKVTCFLYLLKWTFLAGMAKSDQKKDKIERKVNDSKDWSVQLISFYTWNHYNIVNHKFNLKHRAFHPLNLLRRKVSWKNQNYFNTKSNSCRLRLYKNIPWKMLREPKIVLNEVHYIPLWIFSVCIFGWAIAPSKHEA